MRAQLGVGDLLRQRDGADHDDGRLARGVGLDQRVQRRDAQADEVRRRREVRLVGDAARGVEAHRARAQPGAQVGRQVPRAPVVAGDHQRRAIRIQQALGVDQRRDQVRAQRRGDERVAAIARERGGGGVVVGVGEKRSEAHSGQAKRPRRCAAGSSNPVYDPSSVSPATIRSATSAARSISPWTSSRGSRNLPRT